MKDHLDLPVHIYIGQYLLEMGTSSFKSKSPVLRWSLSAKEGYLLPESVGQWLRKTRGFNFHAEKYRNVNSQKLGKGAPINTVTKVLIETEFLLDEDIARILHWSSEGRKFHVGGI